VFGLFEIELIVGGVGVGVDSVEADRKDVTASASAVTAAAE
jgi:hypothetical protein